MNRWLLVGAVLLAGFVLRAWDLDRNGLNTDELYTAKAAFFSTTATVEKDVHPPLYVAAVRVVGAAVSGPVERKARALSVLAGTALMLLLVWAGYAILGVEGALLAALLAAFDPQLVAMSRLARSYALAGLLIGATFPATWAIVRRSSMPRIAALAMLNFLSLLTFSYAVFVMAAQVAIGLVAGRRDKTVRTALVIANGLAGAAFLPWLPTLMEQAGRLEPGGGWVAWSFAPYDAARRFIQVFHYHSPFAGAVDYLYSIGRPAGFAAAVMVFTAAMLFAWLAARRRGADLFGFALGDIGGKLSLGLPVVFLAVPYVLALAAHNFSGSLSPPFIFRFSRCR
ncbi:MAG: hypothetical protein M5R36_23765 [Deltaproteobacteria bacterium]|nr:hypothetical protein [Deltaproteobacteria bacterium]